jgi:hypothetical protein
VKILVRITLPIPPEAFRAVDYLLYLQQYKDAIYHSVKMFDGVDDVAL